MGKKIIRLNESQLKKIIKESVKRVLKESNEKKFQHHAGVNTEYLLGRMLKGGYKNPNYSKIWNWFYEEHDAGEVEFGFDLEERYYLSDWDYWHGNDPEVDGYDITDVACIDDNFIALLKSCPYITPDMLACSPEDAFCKLFEKGLIFQR